MTRRSIIVCSLLLCVSAAGALWSQTPAASSHAATEKQIIALERAINEAIAKGDLKAFHANIAPDATGIDMMGVNKVSSPDFDKMLTLLKVQSWNMDSSQFYWINDSSVIHMYKWTGKATYQGEAAPSPVWNTTVWSNKSGKWMAVFHQETNAMTAAPAAAKPASPAPGKK